MTGGKDEARRGAEVTGPVAGALASDPRTLGGNAQGMAPGPVDVDFLVCGTVSAP